MKAISHPALFAKPAPSNARQQAQTADETGTSRLQGRILSIRQGMRPFARRHWPAIVLFVITAILQIVFFTNSQPNNFPDSGAYAILGKVGWKYAGQMSFRTPGFPMFLRAHFALFGDYAWRTVMATQFVIGTFLPVILYALFYAIARRPGVAAIGGAGFLLDRFSVQLQTVPLTEYLGSWLMLVSLTSFVWAVPAKKWWAAVATGVVFYLMVIVRPSFSLLPYCLVALAFLVDLFYPASRALWRRSLLWYAVLVLTLWVGLFGRYYSVYRHTGKFTLSHQVGLNLTNHVGKYMNLAPDEYAQVRDIYLRHLAERHGEYINLHDAVAWEAETGRPLWEVSHDFGQIAKYIIRHHPGLYFSQVRQNWRRIWTEQPGYVTDIYDPQTGRKGATALFTFIARNELLRFFYLPIEEHLWASPNFLLSVPWLLLAVGGVIVFLRRSSAQSIIAMCAIVGTVFYHILIHIAVQNTEFGRYKLPVELLWFSTLLFMLAWGVTVAVQKSYRYVFPVAPPVEERYIRRGRERRQKGRR
jgi:hypothetical protein